MSDFQVRLEPSNNNASGRLVLTGDLSIRNAQAIHQQILDARERVSSLEIALEDVTSVDLALFQILFSLQRDGSSCVHFSVSENDTVIKRWLATSGLTSLIQST